MALRDLPGDTAYAVWAGICGILVIVYAMSTGAQDVPALRIVFFTMSAGAVVDYMVTSRPGPGSRFPTWR